MADHSLDTLRLAFMQDILPVGVAMVDRVREGGASKVVEVFRSSEDPLQVLRDEGEPAAQSLRERLDQFSPGLGNPVVPVQVSVEEFNTQGDQIDDYESLIKCLDRLSTGMDELETFLVNDDDEVHKTSLDDQG